MRRDLIFTATLAPHMGAPAYVTLDSSTVYRFELENASVRLSPRVMSSAYPSNVGSMYQDGAAIRPRVTGEYRIDPAEDVDVAIHVRIYKDEADQAERRCVQEPGGPGCVTDSRRRGGFPTGYVLMVVLVPIALVALQTRHLWPR